MTNDSKDMISIWKNYELSLAFKDEVVNDLESLKLISLSD